MFSNFSQISSDTEVGQRAPVCDSFNNFETDFDAETRQVSYKLIILNGTDNSPGK